MKQSRSLSQIFLRDRRFIQKIMDAVPFAGRDVLEIGPGSGVMTERIASCARSLSCVELDSRFAAALGARFSAQKTVTIVNVNILSYDLSLLTCKPLIFGNVPYAISNELIRYLVNSRTRFDTAYLTVQKEFADKLAARVSTKPFSFLSCYIQYYARVERLFDIPAAAFSPIPKVDSSFVSLDFYQKLPFPALSEERLFMIIRAAFSQRRKKIANSLRAFIADTAIFESLAIAPAARAENVSLAQYVALANLQGP
jgi:16S rRNA (adenine1518-N6/adenine1519-N6)-dimethyltransferase